MIRKKVPNSPNSRRDWERSCKVPVARVDACAAWLPSAQTIPNAWVNTKTRKMGTMGPMDSLTPRRFISVRTRMPSHHHGELEPQQRGRKEGEDGVGARRDGDGDGQHVVDQQGASGDHSPGGIQELGGHQVAPAAGGEQLDDLAVARGEHEHRDHGAQRHEEAQVVVPPQRDPRLLGTVAGAGQTIRSQAHPGEERQERDALEDGLVEGIARPTQEEEAQTMPPC
jgi:hypothetical protein